MAEPPRPEPDDAALVTALIDGSEAALGMLFDRHARGVEAVAMRLTGDRYLAEEVVQETFLALWNRAELFDASAGSLATWLRAIARNRTIDRLRSAGRRPLLASLDHDPERDAGDAALERVAARGTVIGGASPPADPESSAVAAEARLAVRQALAAMDDDERRVILLAYRDGLSQSEIAERLGWPLGTVKTRTRRGLSHLRGTLERDPWFAARPLPERGDAG
jgi:RNA polymerase sigma-70 factor, ECF subfamily